MAEQTLSELVINLINWIESLHEKNLKYEAQVETLSRDLALAQSSNQQLEARLSSYQNAEIVPTVTAVPVVGVSNHHQVQHQVHDPHQQQYHQNIYQPIANPPPVYWYQGIDQ